MYNQRKWYRLTKPRSSLGCAIGPNGQNLILRSIGRMNELDVKVNEIKALQAELERRTMIEKQAEQLIINGEYQAAIELLKTI